MNKIQWTLTIMSVLAVWGIYMLPKSLVSNKQAGNLASRDNAIMSKNILPPTTSEKATESWTAEEIQIIYRIRKKLMQYLGSKKSIIFADSLTTLYALHGNVDSVEYYIKLILSKVQDSKALKFAGSAYYQLYQREPDVDQANRYIASSREYYTTYVEKNPDDLEAKNNLALTYVVSESPMKGIGLLKEILDTDPKNQTALLNLGLLSMQSGQWDKAISRFESLLAINAKHGKAAFYLANSYIQKGDKKSALKWLNHVIQTSSDKDEVAAAQNLILKLN